MGAEGMREFRDHVMTVDDEVQTLRTRAAFYRRLAASLFDRRTAAEAIDLADELDGDVLVLEARQ